jgi:hypothetical protein
MGRVLELLGKMKVQNDKEIVMYFLMGLPHELVKAITLSNINKPDQIRQYSVRYEQLDSLLAPHEQSDERGRGRIEVELTSDVQTPVTENPIEKAVQESSPNVQSWDHSDGDPNSYLPEQFSSSVDPPEAGGGSYEYGQEVYTLMNITTMM